MKFLHIADLHIGKRMPGGLSLEEDQRHILTQILEHAQKADAVLVAGDLFDRSSPSQEALRTAGWFLSALNGLSRPVFLISGNHDSPELIAYCRELMQACGIFSSAACCGEIAAHSLRDAFGPVRIWLLPFIRPYSVRQALRDEGIQTYGDAVRALVAGLPLNPEERNVLLMHQLVLGGQQSDSEETSIGGLDAIDPALLDPFDYVALGHLHRPQRIGREGVHYAGSPLAYSLSEAAHQKAALLVTLEEKGALSVAALPLVPLHPVRALEGTLAALLGAPSEDFVYCVLTDSVPPMDAGGALKNVFPRLLGYELRGAGLSGMSAPADTFDERLSLRDHFAAFYRMQHGGRGMAPGQAAFLAQLEESHEAR